MEIKKLITLDFYVTLLDTLIIETSKIIQKDQCYDKLNAAGKKYILISLRKKNMVLKFAKPKKIEVL